MGKSQQEIFGKAQPPEPDEFSYGGGKTAEAFNKTIKRELVKIGDKAFRGIHWDYSYKVA